MAIKENDNRLENRATDKDYSSQFKPYSLGVVTAHKGEGTEMIDVTPIELHWGNHGEIINNYAEETVEGLDKNGESIKYSVISSTNITAAWLPMGDSNRISPPELRRGMMVMIYRDSDNNYYWVDLGLYKEYMRAESVTYGFCANPNTTTNKQVSHEDWYIVEFSPRTGQVLMTTSKANGEFTNYTIILNTKEGYLKISDGEGNFIVMDSKNVQHRLENQRGTFIEMLQEDITMDAPKNITINAGQDITVNAGKRLSFTSGAETNFDASSNYTINTGGTYTLQSISYSLNGTSGGGKATGGMRIDDELSADHIKTDSNIKAGGSIHAGGDITASGNLDCKH